MRVTTAGGHNLHKLTVFGIDKITDPIAPIDMNRIKEQFEGVDIDELARQSGEFDF